MASVENSKISFFNPRQTGADEVTTEIEAAGGRVTAVASDLADVTTVRRLFDGAETAFSRVDILVNNTDHCEIPDDTLTTSASSIDRHFTVNTRP